MVIAGNTDLVAQMKQGKVNPLYVIDLITILGLDNMNLDAGPGLSTGTLATIRLTEKSTMLQKRFPIIAQAASQLGHVAIRNIATFGGNPYNAVPSVDMALSLITLAATVERVCPKGKRNVSLEYFFVGSSKTVISITELMSGVQVPSLPANPRGAYLKYLALAVLVCLLSGSLW